MTDREQKFLALDLGITTGFAVFSTLGGYSDKPGEPELLGYWHLFEEEYQKGIEDLDRLHNFSFVVAEEPIIFRGKLGTRLLRIVTQTMAAFGDRLTMVDASRWKSTPFKTAPIPPCPSPHVRDAIRLGLWYNGFVRRSTNS